MNGFWLNPRVVLVIKTEIVDMSSLIRNATVVPMRINRLFVSGSHGEQHIRAMEYDIKYHNREECTSFQTEISACDVTNILPENSRETVSGDGSGSLVVYTFHVGSRFFSRFDETMDFLYRRVKNVRGCTQVVASLELAFSQVLQGPLGPSSHDDDCGHDLNRSAIRDEGCTSWMDQPGIFFAFKIFLAMHHSWLTCLLYGRLFVFIVRRLLFLNYSGNTGNGFHDFGWQCLRVAAIAVLTILKALQTDKHRSRQLVVVGRRRHQQCPRRCITLNWSAIWMCALITGAHAIDVQQEICKSVPHAGAEPLRTRIDPEDVVEESFVDDIYLPLPTDENEALERPPRHLWIGGERARTIFQTITQEHPERATLDTYGLRNIYIGNRYPRVQGTRYEELLQRVAELWDAYSRHHHMRVFVADPQPPDSPPESLVLVVEFPTFDQDHVRARPLLLDTIQDGTASDRRTGYGDMRSVVQDIFPLAGLDGLCWPRGIDECTLFFNERFHGHEDHIEIQHGNYMTLHHTTFQLRYSMYIPRFPRAPQFAETFCGDVDTLGLRTIISMRISPEEGSEKDIIPGFSHGTDTTAGTSQVYSMKSLRNGHPLVPTIGVSLLWWRHNPVYRQISLLYRSS